MTKAEILVQLRDLHEQLLMINEDLKSVDSVDEETVDALGQLVTDAGVLADQAKLKDDNDEDADLTEPHDLLDRIMKFETKHPRVMRFLSQLTDTLAMIGI